MLTNGVFREWYHWLIAKNYSSLEKFYFAGRPKPYQLVACYPVFFSVQRLKNVSHAAALNMVNTQFLPRATGRYDLCSVYALWQHKIVQLGILQNIGGVGVTRPLTVYREAVQKL